MSSRDHQLPASVEEFVRAAPVHRGAIVRALVDAAEATPSGARVLDAGAGQAPYRPLFAHCDYVTQDWSASPHPEAKAADVIADLADLPIDDQQFALVVCTEVLEHVADPAAALREIHRVSRPDGRLLVTVPFVCELHEEPYDFYRYTSHGLRYLLEGAGFTGIEIQPLTGWYSTISQILRHNGLATRSQSPSRRTRAAAFSALVASELLRRAAPRLDSLDERRALPLGWVATATRG